MLLQIRKGEAVTNPTEHSIESLKGEIDVLKAAAHSKATSAADSNFECDGQPSLSPAHPRQAAPNVKATPDQSRPASDKKLSSPQSLPRVLPNFDKKFNVVLYGVEESPSGMSKSARFDSDLSSAVRVLSSINSTIEPQSIKACFRLGKLSSRRARPRPILVKLIKISDVTSSLTKRSNLNHPYVLKPDMPYEQRVRESVLLKERWHLIQSGVHRSSIKIKDNRLIVDKLHSSVIENTFQREADRLNIPNPNLDMSEPLRNAFDNSCAVEDNQESVCHVPSAPADVQGTMPSNNSQPHLSDSCNTSVSLASPPSETPPEPKRP